MSITYTPTTNFAGKDSLPSNDSNKVVKGAEFTTEFSAIQSAFALAAPTSNPTITGTATFDDLTVTGAFTSVGIDDNATSTAITIDSSENVGIGTGTPESLLTLQGNSPAITVNATNNDKPRIELSRDASVNNWRMVNDAASLKHEFGDDSTSWSESYRATTGLYHYWNTDQMSLLPDGTVGIGTSAPDSLSSYTTLEIQGGADVGGALKLSTSEGEFGQLFNFNTTLYAGGVGTTILGTGDGGAAGFLNAYRIDSSGVHRWYDPANGATERLRIASDGNIGINVTDPDAKLEIYSGVVDSEVLNLRGFNADRGLSTSIVTEGAVTDALVDFNNELANGRISFSLGGAEKMRVHSNGNVGIGTDSPFAELSIKDASPQVYLETVSNGNVQIHYNETPDQLDIMVNNTVGEIALGTASTERMRIDSSGNVGIGTDSPPWPLTVGNSAANGHIIGNANPQIQLTSDVNSPNAADEFGFTALATTAGAYTGTTSKGDMVVSANTGNLLFCATSSGAAVERMRIDASGNVGIGTDAPTNDLSFGAASAQISMDTAAGSDSKRLLLTGGGAAGTGRGAYATLQGSDFGGAGTGGDIELVADSTSSGQVRIVTGGSSSMTVDSSGNLLVSRTATTDATTVNGHNLYENGLGYSYTLRTLGTTDDMQRWYTSDGNIAARIRANGTLSGSSDVRLKKNISDADEASKIIAGLKVRKFDWISSDVHVPYGFIAQELNESMPAYVDVPEDADETWTVDKVSMMPMLVKAIQEQQAMIEDLKAEVEALKNA